MLYAKYKTKEPERGSTGAFDRAREREMIWGGGGGEFFKTKMGQTFSGQGWAS